MVKINRPAGAITGVLADVQKVLSIIPGNEKALITWSICLMLPNANIRQARIGGDRIITTKTRCLGSQSGLQATPPVHGGSGTAKGR